jgi:hypothetical protein
MIEPILHAVAADHVFDSVFTLRVLTCLLRKRVSMMYGR